MRKQSISAIVLLSAATTLIGLTASNAYAEPAPELAADCAVLGQIANNAVGTLSPLQAMPVDQAQAERDQYVAELRAQQSGLSSEQGRADLEQYINAVQGATSPAAAQSILSAIGQIRSDCS